MQIDLEYLEKQYASMVAQRDAAEAAFHRYGGAAAMLETLIAEANKEEPAEQIKEPAEEGASNV